MKTVRSFPTMTRRFYRPEQYRCPECQRQRHACSDDLGADGDDLDRRDQTDPRRLSMPQSGVPGACSHVSQCGGRCFSLTWLYRSRIDIVLLLGYLRISLHRSLDEAHRDLLERLAPLGVSISRREVLYLFDAE